MVAPVGRSSSLMRMELKNMKTKRSLQAETPRKRTHIRAPNLREGTIRESKVKAHSKVLSVGRKLRNEIAKKENRLNLQSLHFLFLHISPSVQ